MFLVQIWHKNTTCDKVVFKDVSIPVAFYTNLAFICCCNIPIKCTGFVSYFSRLGVTYKYMGVNKNNENFCLHYT